MACPITRRTFTAGILAFAVPGCLTADGGDGQTEATPLDRKDPETPTPEADRTATRTKDREAMLDDLPEPSPLASPLPELVAAEDREAFANDHDLEYSDGAVTVEIGLEPDGEPPEEYLVEVRSAYGRSIIAVVLVDDLVDLATDENVRIVKPPTESKHN